MNTKNLFVIDFSTSSIVASATTLKKARKPESSEYRVLTELLCVHPNFCVIEKDIQIFGANKCFDTKKAERWFKERRIKYQSIDLVRYGMSGGEFDSVLRAVGGIDRLIDWDKKAPEIDLMRYMGDSRAKEDKVFDNPKLMKTPVVRNGKQATVGYCPEIWETWQ